MCEKHADKTEKNDCCPDDSSRQTCFSPFEKDKSGSCCSGAIPREKMFVFVIIMLAAIGVGGYSLVMKTDPPPDKQSTGTAKVLCGIPTLDSIKTLKKLVVGKKVLFLLLPGKEEKPPLVLFQQVESYVKKLTTQGKQVVALTMQEHAEGYDEVVRQFSVKSFPSVVVWGAGCKSSTLSTDITESKLLRAFVMATTPVSSGCCPKKKDKTIKDNQCKDGSIR